MRKHLHSIAPFIAMSIMAQPAFETSNSSFEGSTQRRKSQLSAPQKKERLKAKRARKARRFNRK